MTEQERIEAELMAVMADPAAVLGILVRTIDDQDYDQTQALIEAQSREQLEALVLAAGMVLSDVGAFRGGQ